MGRELSTPPSPAASVHAFLSFAPSRHPLFTPLSLPLFSCTYERTGLQDLCFQIFTTVGGWWGQACADLKFYLKSFGRKLVGGLVPEEIRPEDEVDYRIRVQTKQNGPNKGDDQHGVNAQRKRHRANRRGFRAWLPHVHHHDHTQIVV